MPVRRIRVVSAIRAAALIAGLWSAAWLAPPAPARAQAPAPAGTARGFIWEVTRDGRTGWLVGSLHVLTPDYYPLPDTIEDAFERAGTLLQEVEIRELESPEMLALVVSTGLASGNETLDTQVPGDTWSAIVSRLARAGLSPEPIRRMRPWLAAITMFGLELQQAGFDPEHGIDQYFRRKVDGTGKAFRTLETAAEQIDYLAGFPPDVQVALLRSYIEDADAQIRGVRELAEAWRTGDTATLDRVLLDTLRESPQVYQSLLVERNRRWMPAIEACLQPGGCFIVVGAGHMVGDDGLIAMLEQRGYRIRQR